MTDTVITYVETQARPLTVAEAVQQLKPAPPDTALGGICEDGMPLIVDLGRQTRVASILVVGNLEDTNCLIETILESYRLFNGGSLAYHDINPAWHSSLPAAYDGMRLVFRDLSNFLYFTGLPVHAGLRHLLATRTAWVLAAAPRLVYFSDEFGAVVYSSRFGQRRVYQAVIDGRQMLFEGLAIGRSAN